MNPRAMPARVADGAITAGYRRSWFLHLAQLLQASTIKRMAQIEMHMPTHALWYSLALRCAALASLFCLAAVPAAARTRGNPPSHAPRTAWVAVSVATLWSSPDSPRPIDRPALTNPVDISKWLADMSVKQRAWLSRHNTTQTQTLYGHKVYILAEQGAWDEVAVPGQSSPKNPLGYPGWVPKIQLVESAPFAAAVRAHPFALVDSAPTVWLYDDPQLAHQFLRISFNTRLPVLARRGNAIEVATPTGQPKWLAASSASVYRSLGDIPHPTAADLTRTGRMFMGLPYLWGGRSGFAYDCSGFTGSIYQSHGILLPRDASAQAADTRGLKLDRADHKLEAGTLMFYADDHGTGHVYHVAMYIGDGKMMEAYDSSTPIRTTKVRFERDYWGAVRILGTPAAATSPPAHAPAH